MKFFLACAIGSIFFASSCSESKKDLAKKETAKQKAITNTAVYEYRKEITSVLQKIKNILASYKYEAERNNDTIKENDILPPEIINGDTLHQEIKITDQSSKQLNLQGITESNTIIRSAESLVGEKRMGYFSTVDIGFDLDNYYDKAQDTIFGEPAPLGTINDVINTILALKYCVIRTPLLNRAAIVNDHKNIYSGDGLLVERVDIYDINRTQKIESLIITSWNSGSVITNNKNSGAAAVKADLRSNLNQRINYMLFRK